MLSAPVHWPLIISRIFQRLLFVIIDHRAYNSPGLLTIILILFLIMIFTVLRINLIFKIFLIIFDIIKSIKGHLTIQSFTFMYDTR